jgi:hypothetical protein
MKLTLCSKCASCPEVVSTKEGVEIGEKGNLVKLKKEEWNMLVDAVVKGRLKKL